MSDNPDLILWGVGTSRTVRPHWAMHELALAYTIKPIGPRTGETKTAEYTKLNARQKIPLLQDGDFRIGESAAIVAYLSRMYSTPERALIPESTRDYAAWLEWCFFIVTELDSTSLYVMRRHSADALGPIYGVAPEVVAQAAQYFRAQLRHVEVALADGRHFIMGERFSSADILLTTCLDWAVAYGVGICDNARPYLDRMRSREAYQRAAAANAPRAPITPTPAKA
ncbi:glutathione S-transferase family protein [Bradyrhizobium sp. 4]|uniref:glutathione S-transferase family protein n=1 Tax=unclassified Bradyrhizobium TaxID=2631580 RepID=UPI001FFAA4F1|nr:MULTISPECIES: glutathione S-transferase family protein [unclassified Bradyrhizobium]MCK1399832.1 glutathione S-transferase family protein [Bradyrhizobium sp. 39]MCK1747558.1 glutathione S-transferase family protein [Bradyrhizobium sp. 135]UPJ33599.1 glutathione S-transferase family protein [Bradyrhizobium sp. 4]